MMNRLCLSALLPLLAVLAGCDMVVLNPSGDIAAQQRDLLVTSTWLMLLIIVPVMALIIAFAWRYRASNREARYEPDWHHSMRLELVIWSAPLIIIICLGALTWLGTHLLDPYRPLDRIAAGKVIAEQTKSVTNSPTKPLAEPLEIKVVALDWKWLFIYPELGVATINELAVPVDRPLSLRITASSVMNSLYIPELAGMIYAMPGMQTQLQAVLNKQGDSEGFSANYSGAGFSGMRFKLRGLDAVEFDRWVQSARSAQQTLTRESYLQLEKPSEREPIRHFAAVDAQLFDAIVGRCVQPGKMCMHDMMAIDARGGLGLAGIYNVARSTDARPRAVFGAAHDYVIGVCTAPAPLDDRATPFARVDRSPLRGAGLPQPTRNTSLLLARDTVTSDMVISESPR
jgi:cytochrome o ubiquinol oxidase subunit 2